MFQKWLSMRQFKHCSLNRRILFTLIVRQQNTFEGVCINVTVICSEKGRTNVRQCEGSANFKHKTSTYKFTLTFGIYAKINLLEYFNFTGYHRVRITKGSFTVCIIWQQCFYVSIFEIWTDGSKRAILILYEIRPYWPTNNCMENFDNSIKNCQEISYIWLYNM